LIAITKQVARDTRPLPFDPRIESSMYSIILGEAGATVMEPPTAMNRSNEVNATALLAHLVKYRRDLNVSSMDPHAKAVVRSAYNILAGINALYRIQDSFCNSVPAMHHSFRALLRCLSPPLVTATRAPAPTPLRGVAWLSNRSCWREAISKIDSKRKRRPKNPAAAAVMVASIYTNGHNP
jgi:hypothetical protein